MEKGRLFELRRRTFDTPHFRGIEFIEAEAKTIINKVPGNYLPFSHTINPYRGCSHACAYCLAGDTPILMADGRAMPIRDVRVGDQIYGTERVGQYRKYVTTSVLAQWSTTKSAFRISLSDGTSLIASGDHRFLSERGWKHVTGSEQGSLRRPHLTSSNRLIGTGQFPEPPKCDSDYVRGYLCGAIRGDGHVGSYSYVGSQRTRLVHRFRLALKDSECLMRTRKLLRECGIETREFPYARAKGRRAEMRAIRTSKQRDIAAIRTLISWPEEPTPSWLKGFLAGIFDAEGCYSKGILRISNTDSEIISYVRLAMGELGFRSVIEQRDRSEATNPRFASNDPLYNVRLLGGLTEALRFFLTTDPAISRKRSIRGLAVKHASQLNVVSIEPLELGIPMFDITTGTGDFIANGVVSHNCFARVTHNYMDMNAGRDFESKIVVKVNAPELLRKELAAKRWKGDHIAMGTATDPYQRAEGRYKLMPQIITALTESRNPFSILTKGTLILRDLDLLVDAAKVADVGTAFSVPTLDGEVWRRSEPGTPHPRKRMDAVRKLNENGIPCGVMVAPILPGISDKPNQLMDVVKAAVDAGATFITPILLHLRPVVREEYMAWLGDAYPGLVKRYEEMYTDGAYGPKEARRRLGRRVAGLVQAAGGTRDAPRRTGHSEPKPPVLRTKQLQLL